MQKVALFILVFLLLPVIFLSVPVGAAESIPPPSTQPPQPTQPTTSAEDEKPLLENGRVVTNPLVYTPRTAAGLAGDKFQTTPNSPAITVWYGNPQSFGHNGNPQRWINILGNVSGSHPITSLTYSLNNGLPISLNSGPDDRRLTLPGDFIIELNYTNLQQGANQLIITAADNIISPTIANVTIHYDGGRQRWEPGSYTYDWQTATTINDLGQVVTGEWALDTAAGTVQPIVFDYDRLLAIGDMSWRDYTVTVPVTINAIDASGFSAPSNGPGIGVLVRWRGHTDHNNLMPRVGWRELGALAWYRWRKSDGQITSGMQLLGNGGRILAENGRPLTFGETYFFKVNIQSAAGDNPATYRFKMWNVALPEPDGWDFAQIGKTGEPESGSLLLLAHHVDAEFGSVTVQLDSTETVSPPPEAIGVVYIIARGSGSMDGISYTAEDILSFDMSTNEWELFFDGSTAGLPPKGIDAFHRMDDGSLLISLGAPGRVPGLGTVDDADIIRFVPSAGGQGQFEWYFDGSDVGLTTNAEDVDAIALTADQQLTISTTGKVTVDGVTATGADLLLFTATTYGAATSGVWSLYFDGSDVGLTSASEGINGVWIAPGSGDIYLTAAGAFSVPGLSGVKNDIFVCAPVSLGENTACAFDPALFWRGSNNGFKKPIYGLDIELN